MVGRRIVVPWGWVQFPSVALAYTNTNVLCCSNASSQVYTRCTSRSRGDELFLLGRPKKPWNPCSVRWDTCSLEKKNRGIWYRHKPFSTGHWTRDNPPPVKKTPDQILVARTGERRAKSDQLRRALVESGVSYVCSKCGLDPEWQGAELVLEVDHIDGNWRNCLKSNLRFLCPNCHSQTQVGGSGKCACGKNISRKSIRCRGCHLRQVLPCQNTKGDWPTPAELAVQMWKKPATAIAKEIGVSSSRLKQKCRAWGIETPSRGYWSKTG